MKRTSVAIGSSLALFGAGLFAMAAVDVATGGDGKTPPASYVGLLLVFAGVIWWGLQIARPALSPSSLADRIRARWSNRLAASTRAERASMQATQDRESRVLRLAETKRGRVTVLEVAASCGLTVDEAKATLDWLVLQKAATMQVSESGILVYAFPAFLATPRKRPRRRK